MVSDGRLLLCGIAVLRTTAGFASPTCQGGSEGEACVASTDAPHPWPWSGKDLNQSGAGAHIGPLDLSRPTWIFKPSELPPWPFHKVFTTTPVIDDQLNVYAPNTIGVIFSLNKRGEERWSLQLPHVNPGGVALAGDALFTLVHDGHALKINRDTGKEIWRSKIADSGPTDSFSLMHAGDVVLTVCNFLPPDWHRRPHYGGGGDSVCAFSPLDGHLVWNYSLAAAADDVSYNFAPIAVGDAVIFGDRGGGVHCVGLADGQQRWWTPGTWGSWTTGGVAVGPLGLAYMTANPGHPSSTSPGILRALNTSTGHVSWTRTFHEPLNSKPAVGRVCCDKQGALPLAVIVNVGRNPSCDPLTWSTWVRKHLGTLDAHHGAVTALHAGNGSHLWSFYLPIHRGPVQGISVAEPCCPDMYGPTTVGADGTVYVNWSGGYSFALRDANGDGTIDTGDFSEFSSHYHGHGSQSGTALAEGLATMATCKQVLGYAPPR